MFHKPIKEHHGLYSLSATSLRFRWHEDRQTTSVQENRPLSFYLNTDVL